MVWRNFFTTNSLLGSGNECDCVKAQRPRCYLLHEHETVFSEFLAAIGKQLDELAFLEERVLIRRSNCGRVICKQSLKYQSKDWLLQQDLMEM